MSEKNRLIEKANEAYYEGDNPLLTDEEFNLLADSGLERGEGHTFRKKIKHTIPMGSLSKAKSFEEFNQWLMKNMAGSYLISPKVDGNSIAITYKDGKLVSAATRGDGEYGNDCTDKVKASGTIPVKLHGNPNLTVRCEAVLPRFQQEHHEKNIRNVVSGLLNSKDVNPSVTKVKFLAFDSILLDDGATLFSSAWRTHQAQLEDWGFQRIEPVVLSWGSPAAMFEEVTTWFESWDNYYPYFIDGVVIERLDLNDCHQDKTDPLPTHMTAVKFQRAPVRAKVGQIEWTLGMHDKLAPVLILEAPVTIDGTSVQRISASNYAIVCAAGLWPGAEIGVVKSGDIIPYVAEVYERSTIENIVVCPECGIQAQIEDRRVDLVCGNDDCPGKQIVELQTIFRVFGIDGISDKTIENLYKEGFCTVHDIVLAFANDLAQLDGWGLKSAKKFKELTDDIQITEAQIIAACGIRGIGTRQAEKLIYAYGDLQNLIQEVSQMKGLKIVEGFGDILSKQVVDNIQAISHMEIDLYQAGVKFKDPVDNLMSVPVCVTGQHSEMGRKEFSRFLEAKGYKMVTSVTKDCKIVLTADLSSNSGKMKKAKARDDVEVMLYEDFDAWLLQNESGVL